MGWDQHCDILRRAAEAGGVLVDAVADSETGGSWQGVGGPRLMVVESGAGSPCMNFSQVSMELAAACEGADLVGSGRFWKVLEGSGRF